MGKKQLKILLSFLFVCLLVSGVAAIWIVSIMSTATYRIESQAYGGLVVNQDLSGNLFNSLDGVVSSADLFIFTNEGEEVDVDINITTIKTNTDETCLNWDNDCEVIYSLNHNQPLSEGQNIKLIWNGENNVSVVINCLQYSCPQDITPIIKIEKIPV